MQVIIDKGQRSNCIRIIGLMEDVTDVTANVVKILANTKLKEQEKDEAERLVKQVSDVVLITQWQASRSNIIYLWSDKRISIHIMYARLRS